MIIVTITIFFAIFLTVLEDRKILRNGMFFGFSFIIILFSLRYRYGNDYISYEAIYLHIAQSYDISHALRYNDYEAGWVSLNYLLKPFGFQSVIFLITLISNFLIYKIIKKFVPTGWYWLAVSWYLLNPDLFLLNISMLRQGIAEILMLVAVCYAYKRKYFIPILLILIAVLLHKSSAIMIPFVLLGYFCELMNIKYTIYLIVIICVYLITNENITTNLFNYIMQSNLNLEEFRKYVSEDDTGVRFGLGVLLQIVAVLPILLNLYKYDAYTKYLLLLYIISFIFLPFASFSFMILRLRNFFILFGLLLFPMYLSKEKDCPLKYVALTSIIIYSVYSYFGFFSSATYGYAYSTFYFISL